ncbi:MAG: Cro/CI family transcriptional regulator [Anaerosporomusa subterranea]|nr:Cro/CI family transcriptional regulator [Anaerosporomusa subterranea]MDF2572307.1 Cro/CI family transcriptional regulator [Sporomusa sp.]
MAIKCNLSTYMGMYKMNIQDVCDETGLARNTVAFLYHDKVKAINFGTLDSLCKLFKCSAGDLLEYVPDVEEPQQ